MYLYLMLGLLTCYSTPIWGDKVLLRAFWRFAFSSHHFTFFVKHLKRTSSLRLSNVSATLHSWYLLLLTCLLSYLIHDDKGKLIYVTICCCLKTSQRVTRNIVLPSGVCFLFKSNCLHVFRDFPKMTSPLDAAMSIYLRIRSNFP